MKAYVNYFDSDGVRARAETGDESIRDDECVIQYNPSPIWKTGLFEAQNNCAVLNRANVHAYKLPNHWCQFEIEEVGQDEYAIVCQNHPDTVNR